MAGWIAVNCTFRELFHSEDTGWGWGGCPGLPGPWFTKFPPSSLTLTAFQPQRISEALQLNAQFLESNTFSGDVIKT